VQINSISYSLHILVQQSGEVAAVHAARRSQLPVPPPVTADKAAEEEMDGLEGQAQEEDGGRRLRRAMLSS
jgi:hypothetical protein